MGSITSLLTSGAGRRTLGEGGGVGVGGVKPQDIDKIGKLGEALRQEKPIRITLTNYCKDGSEFQNMLLMKPVYDDDGRYAYVIAFQFDLPHGSAGGEAFLSESNRDVVASGSVPVPSIALQAAVDKHHAAAVSIADGLLKFLPLTLSGTEESESRLTSTSSAKGRSGSFIL
jgi:hypothetical protein